MVREIGQEVIIDPWIESAVSGWVRRAGGDAMMQMVLSSVAESLRETLTGPFANLFSSQRSGGASFYERLDARYFSKDLTPTIQDLLNSFNEYKAEIEAQIELQKEQMTALGRGMKALTFVLGAAGFGVAQFIGPPASLFYASLATVCFTEEISLKGMFSKTFNPVMVAADKISKSKVGDYYRNNKKEILFILGIGVAAVGMRALQTLLPPLAILGDFALGFGVPITIGMTTDKNTHIIKKGVDLDSRTSEDGEITLKVRKEDVLLKASTGAWNSRKLSDLQISIHKYSRTVVDKYIDSSNFPLYVKGQPKIILDNQIIDDLYGSKDFITQVDRFFDFAVKHREYKVLIYEISLKEPLNLIWHDYSVGEYIGLTHGTEKVRFGFHIKTALATYTKHIEGKRLITPTKLSAAIIAALKDKGFSDYDLKKLYHYFKNIRSINTDQKMWNLIQDLSDSHFKIKVLEIHKNKELGYEREIQLTQERKLVEEGLNMKLGGGARESAYVFLPLYDIIGLISLGFTMRAITSLMREHYGIRCHEETVRKRIIEFFGGWDKAQQMFLKPVVEALTYEGYNHLEIYKKLGKNYRESKGWIFEWFAGKEQLDFEFWIGNPNFDTEVINKIIREVNNRFYGYTRSQWEAWLLEGKSREEICRETGLTESIVRNAYISFGGKRNFVTNYRIRRTIELRKQGWSMEDIYIKELGFRTTKFLKRDFGKWFKGQFPGFTGDIIKKIEETWSLKNIGNYLG